MANEVSVALVADITSALKSIESFQSEAVKSLKQVEKSTNQLKFLEGFELALNAGKIAADIFASGFNKIKGVLGDSIKAASEQEDAIQRLNVALATQGNFTEETSESLQRYSEELQKNSKFADEVILSNIGLLESLTSLNEDGLKAGAKAATDMAAALGIDLDTAFRLVGKAANGEVGAFSRYNIEVRKGADNAETFTNALAALNKQFGGAAAGQLNTYSGALAQANNSFGDLLEEVGNLIIKNPVIIAGINQATKLFIELSGLIKGNSDNLRILITDGFLSLVKVIPLVIESLSTLDYVFTNIATISIKFNSALKSITGFFAEINSSGAVLNQTLGYISVKGKDLNQIINAQQNALKKAAAAQNEVSEAVSEEIYANNKQIESLENSKKVRGDIIKQVQALADGFVDSVNKQADALGKTAVKNNTAYKNQIASVRQLTEEEQKRFDNLSKGSGLFGLLTANPEIKITIADFSSQLNKSLSSSEKQIVSSFANIGASALKGTQGAIDLFSQGLSAVAETFLPGIGGAVSQIVSVLALGPEKVKQMLTEFFNAIPMIVENIIFALLEVQKILPDLILNTINGIIESLPEIIVALVENFILQTPRIINSLIAGLPRLVTSFISDIPQIVQGFIKSFSENIPALVGQIGQGIVDAIKGAIGDIGGGIVSGVGGGVGGFVSSIGGALGFADGGEIPSGFPNDSGIIRAQSGERILDRETNEAFKQFVRNGGSSGQQQMTVILQVGEEQLAKALFNINRAGFRTA